MGEMMKKTDENNYFCMIFWPIFGILFYLVSYLISNDFPVIQVIFVKLGHVTTLAWVGYWISRRAIGRLDRHNSTATVNGEYFARAIIIGATMIAGSLGL